MKKKVLFLVLALALSLGLVTTSLAANTYDLLSSGQTKSSDFYIQHGTLWEYRGQSQHVEIPNNVTEIGVRAFEKCSNLESVTIPSSVTTIGENAFSGCSNLESVTIPSSVTTIGSFAFEDCSTLESVTIPSTVTTIDSRAFSGCSNLKSITIPSGVTTIGQSTFEKCSNLESVTIPSSVTIIEYGAFRGCSNLKSITIPSGVTTIDQSTFEGCSNLESVTIPNGVTTIGKYAFDECSNLKSVTIPNGVTTIGDFAFNGCNNLESLTIPSSVTTIGQGAFPGGNSNLKSVTIQNSVISDNAFYGCSNLESVTIENGVTTIGRQAFYGCSNLESITIPSSVTTIGDHAFDGCSNLESVTIENGVTTISQGAFMGCSNLESVTLPSSVTTIGDGAFRECSNLKSVTFPQDGPLHEAMKATPYPSIWYFKLFHFDSALEEFVNFPPNKEADKLIASNKAVIGEWINPGEYVHAQDERITAVANQICAGLSNDYEKAKAVCEWVVTNIEYDYDYYYGKKSTVTIYPTEVLNSKLTICDGYTQLTQALLQSQGIPALNVRGKANGKSGWEGHAWNMAFVDGRWIVMDCTWGLSYFDPGILYLSFDHRAESRFAASEKDTPSEWAKTETWDAICSGLVPNYLQNDYKAAITREDFCVLMVKLVEETKGELISSYLAAQGLTITDPFTDTDNNFVLAAHALGIVNGTSDTTFTPDGAITRQEAATMLTRTAKVLGLSSGSGEPFSDADQFPAWAKESIAFISGITDPTTGSRVMGGTGNGIFAPADTFSRQQAFATSLRLFHCAK